MAYSLYLSYFKYNLIFINLTHLDNATIFIKSFNVNLWSKNSAYIINYFLGKSYNDRFLFDIANYEI